MSAERMDFKEFTDVIRENIRDYLPDSYRDAEIKVEEFHKLDHSYMGMQVKREGQTVVPNINLDAHYSTFMRHAERPEPCRHGCRPAVDLTGSPESAAF